LYNPLFFDLDGTLTDSKSGIVAAVQFALAKLGLPEFDEAEIVGSIGGPLRQVVAEHHRLDQRRTDMLVVYFRDYYRRIGIFENVLFAGMEDLLGKLHRAGRRMALATAKPTDSAHRVLQHFRLDRHFDIVCGSDPGAGLTDKTEILRHAIDQLGLDGSTAAVMIGDRRHDVEAAQAARIASIGVAWGYASPGELARAAPSRLVDSPATLEAVLLGN